MPTLPTALIDLAALGWNYRLLRDKATPAETAAAIKANGYGLGLVPVAEALYAAGCRTFFIAHFTEALAVRAALPEANIAVLHGLERAQFAEAREYGITPVINHLKAVEQWAAFARERGEQLPAIIHLDTGMNRLGLPPAEQERLAANHALLNGIAVQAWMSHLACADEIDEDMTILQRDRFLAVARRLPAAPLSLCNSSGIFWGRYFLFDMVRPGAALYGINPVPHLPNPMRPVLTLQAPILQLRDVDAGMTVGYGAAHRFTQPSRVATLALGYADGFRRALGEKGFVKIGSHLAPLIGRVSMDLVTVDVTEVPESAAYPGAMATVIGPHRPIDAIASDAGTIGYEILTSLGPRIARIYQGAAA